MSNDIQRIQSNERLSRVVVHNGIAYLSGVTANDTTTGVMAQTSDVLGKIDAYLELAGTDKSRLLSVQIWLRDIDRDFDDMNKAWAQWIPEGSAPARATGEGWLAGADILVEMIVTAAI